MFAIPSKAGRWVELTKVLEQARTDHPHDPATAVFLAAARAQSGNLKDARDLLEQMGELLEPGLTHQQRAEGQQRASAFVPPDASANTVQGASGNPPPADLLAKATGGDATAQHELGVAFQTGKLGLAKDPVAAAKWFRQAAEQNFAPAQNCLGVCYERGDGVPKHEVEAYKWYLLAAAKGDERATDNAGLLELGLSSDQIAQGKRRAENFKPLERSQP